MKRYPKIQTIFERDPENNYKTLIEGKFSKPEFDYLQNNEWVFTEKVHGTNTRVIWNNKKIVFKGKKEKSKVPKHVKEMLDNKFSGMYDVFSTLFGLKSVCLYGESYGNKIHKEGSLYKDDGHDFVLFDVKIDGYWLERENVEDIADNFGLDVVPIVGYGDLKQAVKLVKGGFESIWGDFTAEGIIAKPETQLYNREGKRIITKLKHKDFK